MKLHGTCTECTANKLAVRTIYKKNGGGTNAYFVIREEMKRVPQWFKTVFGNRIVFDRNNLLFMAVFNFDNRNQAGFAGACIFQTEARGNPQKILLYSEISDDADRHAPRHTDPYAAEPGTIHYPCRAFYEKNIAG